MPLTGTIRWVSIKNVGVNPYAILCRPYGIHACEIFNWFAFKSLRDPSFVEIPMWLLFCAISYPQTSILLKYTVIVEYSMCYGAVWDLLPLSVVKTFALSHGHFLLFPLLLLYLFLANFIVVNLITIGNRIWRSDEKNVLFYCWRRIGLWMPCRKRWWKRKSE